MLIATGEAGRVVKKPSKPAIGRMLASSLRRCDAHLVLERVEEDMEGGRYVQVLLRDDNTYHLEFRDSVAVQRCQTRTISQEKVLTALLGWAVGKEDWKNGPLDEASRAPHRPRPVRGMGTDQPDMQHRRCNPWPSWWAAVCPHRR
ncbi:hypothetical protein [Streptomyces sp. SP18CS02]|uniref:hypothetical protein n=1 Tax=Streptomyces sp. SP18CS02 TaxID=3002531 RepID=UPI002E775786|nr:hypothetical protein [Streptomyces sp. SP18CS02]MEE1751209.1 hypothetical protein [Streptomyces sp. SP18CS02]